jgi:succinate dehydrogenase / fumarate reductase, membrane anchor subunit
MSLKSPLGQVLGLGAAGGGAHHWWVQRVSAVALAPLGVWFVASLVTASDLSYGAARAWLAAPLHAVLMALLVATAAYHSWLGVGVIIEDYVADKSQKVVALLTSQLLHVVVGAAALFAVLKVALGSAA